MAERFGLDVKASEVILGLNAGAEVWTGKTLAAGPVHRLRVGGSTTESLPLDYSWRTK